MKDFSWLDTPAWLPLVHALLHTLWQGALAAGGLFLALRLVPVHRANLRYGLSMTALILVLLLGVGSWALLDTPPPLLPGTKTSQRSFAAVRWNPPDRSSIFSAATLTPSGRQKPIRASGASLAVAANDALGSPEAWVHLAAVFWLLGVGVFLLRTAKSAFGAGQLCHRCQDLADPWILALTEELRTRLGLSRRVRLLVSAEIGVPSVMGILWPAVLLPASMLTGVPREQLRAILAHELAHIRRWDYLVNLAQMLVEALLFFNPFVWWISRQVRVEREACCDQLAASECQSPASYVEALIAVIEHCRSSAGPTAPVLAASGSAFSHGGNHALDRARRLLVPGYQPKLRLRWFSLVAVLALCGLALSGLWAGARAVAQTVQMPPPPNAKSAAPPNAPVSESFTATVSTEDGAPAADDSATAHIYESAGPGSGVTIGVGINQPGLIVNHQKGRFTIWPRAESRTLSCAVSMQGFAAVFAGPFAAPFTELENIHLTLRKGYVASIETTDEAGKPIAGTRLEAYYPGPPQVALGEVKTDASGTAALEHIGEKPLNVRASVNGFQMDEIKNIRLDPAKPYRWTLKRGLRTAGIVTDEFHQPIAGATVKLAGVRGALDITNLGPDGAPLLATADFLGGFVLTALRADCSYYFFVEAPGYSGVYVREYNPASGALLVNLGPELMVRGKVLHIPDSAFFLGAVPLFYSQSFMYQDNGFASAQRSLSLHPKDGESNFSIGPFFMTQTGSTPGMHAPWDNGQVAMRVNGFPEVKITVEDMKGFEPLLKSPRFGITYDLAEKTPPVVTLAALLSQLNGKPSAATPPPQTEAKPALVPMASPAAATPALPYNLTATPEITKAFPGGEGIEIQAITGTASNFQVGGTYRIIGSCQQQTLGNATLYIGNTVAEPASDPIAPFAGSSLYTPLPKGSTRFDVTFTLLRAGVLHLTVYDLDNHNKDDNAHAGISLGKVVSAEALHP